MNRTHLYMFFQALFVVVGCVAIFGSVARANGQTQPSPREQLQQYVTQLRANPADNALRTKIIQLALTLEPKPAVPEDAQAADGKAKTIFAHATSPDDLKAAAAAFVQASLLAPWVPDYYFNEAAAAEKAAQYDQAIHALNFYLLAVPNAPDAGEVRGRIEALKELESKSQSEKDKEFQDDAQKYVGGGAERVSISTYGHSWPVGWDRLEFFAYACMSTIPGICDRKDSFFRNVFEMPGDQALAVLLEPVARENRVVGEQIYLFSLSSWRGSSFAFGTANGSFQPTPDHAYIVDVSEPGPDGVVSVVERASGAYFTMPLRDLQAARIQSDIGYVLGDYGQEIEDIGKHWLFSNEGWRIQAGPGGYYVLYFEPINRASRNSGIGPSPKYAFLIDPKGDRWALADTGYSVVCTMRSLGLCTNFEVRH